MSARPEAPNAVTVHGAGRSKRSRDRNVKRGKERKRKKQRKARVCRNWLNGTCWKGDLCHFLHKMPDKSKERKESDKLMWEQAALRQTPSQRMQQGGRQTSGFGGGSVPVFGSVVERYYTQLYQTNFKGRDHHDHFVYMHSNRMCVMGIAPSHEIFANLATNPVQSVSFTIHNRGRVTRDLTQLSFSGKRKKGTPSVEGSTTICQVTMADGRVYNIPAVVPGRVLEVNLRLMENPSLLVDAPLTKGFIALVDPNSTKVLKIQGSLLTRERYLEERGKDSRVRVPQASAVKVAKAPPTAAAPSTAVATSGAPAAATAAATAAAPSAASPSAAPAAAAAAAPTPTAAAPSTAPSEAPAAAPKTDSNTV